MRRAAIAVALLALLVLATVGADSLLTPKPPAPKPKCIEMWVSPTYTAQLPNYIERAQ